MKTTTRIERIAELNASINALTVARDNALLAHKTSEYRALCSKISLKLADKQGLECELYEAFGVTV